MTFYKPRAYAQITVPYWGSNATEEITIDATVLSAKWVKNHHLAADELSVTIPYAEGGIDPRMIKHGRIRFWMWDDAFEPLDLWKHMRFLGICKKASRKLTDQGWAIDMTFHDFTTFFLMMKPFPSDGMPEWTDTLPQIWAKICDNVGYRDISGKRIVSNVAALKDSIEFFPPTLATKTLGEIVNERFLKISKPTPKVHSDAWAVWQYCVQSLGLVSYIDRDRCVVTPTNEYYKPTDAPQLIYGQNILGFEEHADTHVAHKGLLGKSFDIARGRVLESAWPPPDDPFIKKSRAVVKRALKNGTEVGVNETSGDYEEYNFPEVSDQATLDARVREAWEEFSRQEMKGKIRTRELRLPDANGKPTVDILSLNAGDCISVGMDHDARDGLDFSMPLNARIAHLMETQGYIYEVASLVARNISQRAFDSPIFHVETLEVELRHDSIDIDISYHNKVNLSGTYDPDGGPDVIDVPVQVISDGPEVINVPTVVIGDDPVINVPTQVIGPNVINVSTQIIGP